MMQTVTLEGTTQATPPPSRRLVRFMGDLFVAVGLLLLAYSAIFYGYLFYQQQQSGLMVPAPTLPRLVAAAEPSLLAPRAPAEPAQPSVGAPPQRIRIPSIGVDAPVVALGTTYNEQGDLVWETAKHAVGHHQGSANPGEPSNIVMSGHISSPVRGEGNVFGRLPYLKEGETVAIDTEQGTHQYRVVARRVVEPTETDVMDPTPTSTLTLITCYPDLVYSHRLIVTAVPAGFEPKKNA